MTLNWRVVFFLLFVAVHLLALLLALKTGKILGSTGHMLDRSNEPQGFRIRVFRISLILAFCAYLVGFSYAETIFGTDMAAAVFVTFAAIFWASFALEAWNLETWSSKIRPLSKTGGLWWAAGGLISAAFSLLLFAIALHLAFGHSK